MNFSIEFLALLLAFLFQISPFKNGLDTQPYFILVYLLLCLKSAKYNFSYYSFLYFSLVLFLGLLVTLAAPFYPSGFIVLVKNLIACISLMVSFNFFRSFLVSIDSLCADREYRRVRFIVRMLLLTSIAISFASIFSYLYPPFSSFLSQVLVPNSRSAGDRLIDQVSRGAGSGGLFNEPSFAIYSNFFCLFLSYIIVRFKLSSWGQSFAASSRLLFNSLRPWFYLALLSFVPFLFLTGSGAILAIVLLIIFSYALSFFAVFASRLTVSKRILLIFAFSLVLVALVISFSGFLSTLPFLGNSRFVRLISRLSDVSFLDILISDRSIFTRTINLVVGFQTLFYAPLGWGLGGFNSGYVSLILNGQIFDFGKQISEVNASIPLIFLVCIGGWFSILSIPILLLRPSTKSSINFRSILSDPVSIFCILSLTFLPLAPAWPIVGIPFAYLALKLYQI